MQEWGALTPYAFPPFILIGSAAKNETGASVGSMFDHVWRAQPWFPLVLEMSIDSPVLIPMKDTLTDPIKIPTQWYSVVVSNQSLVYSRKPRNFREGYKCHSLLMEERNRRKSHLHGASGTAGAIKKIMIPFQHQ